MFDLGYVNWLGVAIAVVVTQVLGALWYGPLFGKQWLAAIGRTREEVAGQSAAPAYAAGVVGALLAAIVLSLWLGAASGSGDASDVGPLEGLVAGIVAGLAFPGAATVTAGMFENRNKTLTNLYVGYQVVCLALTGLILTLV